MDIHVGDILVMKKNHPCGSKEWSVLRVGMDFRVRCVGCGREMENKRAEVEKQIRRVMRNGVAVPPEELAKTRTDRWEAEGKG